MNANVNPSNRGHQQQQPQQQQKSIPKIIELRKEKNKKFLSMLSRFRLYYYYRVGWLFAFYYYLFYVNMATIYEMDAEAPHHRRIDTIYFVFIRIPSPIEHSIIIIEYKHFSRLWHDDILQPTKSRNILNFCYFKVKKHACRVIALHACAHTYISR